MTRSGRVYSEPVVDLNVIFISRPTETIDGSHPKRNQANNVTFLNGCFWLVIGVNCLILIGAVLVVVVGLLMYGLLRKTSLVGLSGDRRC